MHAAGIHRAGSWIAISGLCLAAACSLDNAPSLGRHAALAADSGDTHPTTPPMNPEDAASPPNSPRAPSDDPLVTSPTTAQDGGSSNLLDAARPRTATDAADDADSSQPGPGAPSSDAGLRACIAGIYAADITCTVDPTVATDLTATGQVRLTLSPSTQPTELTVANWNLAFTVAGFVFAGDLSGALDCSTGSFHADVINGVFTSVLFPIGSTFNGQFDAKLDSSGHSLSGMWFFTANTGVACTGPFNATLQP